MISKYSLLEEDLKKIRARDQTCVYCHKPMTEYLHQKGTPKDKATIEHLNTRPPWSNSGTVVYCCGSCNSSRGAKELIDWFCDPYCTERGINEYTVDDPVKKYVRFEKFVHLFHWTFAKTMPEIPHFYIVRDKLSDEDKNTFDDFVAYISTNGYSRMFGAKNYKYINIENFKYWVDENILNREELN